MATEDSRGKEASVTLRVLAAIMGGRELTISSVVREFGVSEGTSRRALQLLAQHVPGVSCDKSKTSHVYAFKAPTAGSVPEAKRTTLAEAVAVSMAAAFSRVFTGSQYEVDLRALRSHLIENLPSFRKDQFVHPSRKFVAIGEFEESLDDRGGLLDEVLEALLNCKRLAIEYEKFGDTSDSRERRIIQPYTLAIHDSHFYLVGSDCGLSPTGLRTFRFSRIAAAEVLDETFEYPAPTEYDPATVFRDSIGIWCSGIEPTSIRIRLSAKWRTTCQHHRWHSSQQVAPLDSGEVELSFRVRPCPEFEKWILGFGEDAEVIEPDSLRLRIIERLRGAARRYDTTPVTPVPHGP